MWKCFIFCLTFVHFVKCDEHKYDILENNQTDLFTQDASVQSLQKVHLMCGGNSMQIELETNEDFDGILYTRGNFNQKMEPCFVKQKLQKGSRSIAMKFNFDQCQTLHENNIYSNVVVVQRDADLITPGDSAFSIVCNFREPRRFTLQADIKTRDRTQNKNDSSK